jgi:stearoyl-CoA desaturase (delta-9 desaturase)
MTILRYVIALHLTWCTNSFAHSDGKRPYDKNIRPSEVNFLGWMGIGEGWHNFHHTFPWDYKLSEVTHSELTYIWRIVDIFAAIGWTYDLKTVSQDMIRKRVLRTGDGSHKLFSSDQNANIVEQDNFKGKAFWGWDDKDVSDYDKSATLIK